ncbi:DUF4179 domain-containing protein [Metabacillus malikii]|uniref:DUF4179 domain-containing protein n=1 Tax=Metabacillus malikii TaxID=1504265 RepID=A0ABT9ZLN6_9BACI|nr:DUF4179 domain-containing protein [Metabacillus malikii]MDQ0233203.1 hypothetical protein [Metabacillus malikii]
MKNLFESLNDEKITLLEFEDGQITDIEKKATKKRIKAKLKSRSGNKKRILAVAASLVVITILGMNTKYTLADIPIIGDALEKFVHSQEGSLSDYKTVIGESVESNGVKLTLNEIILDEGQLLISSTFHTDISDNDLAYNWYSKIEVYINGKKSDLGGGGGPEGITNSAVNYFWTSDLKNIKLQDNQQIKIVFNDLERSDSKKLIKGKWSFEFTASGEKLRADKKSIPANKYFILEEGQKVTVEELILTPVSTVITYKMEGISNDLYFRLEDQNGMKLQEFSRQLSSDININRFIALENNIVKLKVIPYIYSNEAGVDNNEVILYDEIFEIDVK